MTVLVTGAAGYIGSHVVLALTDAGERVILLDNLSGGSADLVPSSLRLEFVKGDVGDRDLMHHLICGTGVDAVMHLAAFTSVPESVKDPLRYYRNNTTASLCLLEAAAERRVPVVFSSTAAVYGAPETIPVGEEAPCNPESPYGASKLMVEWMLRDLDRSCMNAEGDGRGGFTYVVLRYFNVAGADPEGRTGHPRNAGHLISSAIDAALGRTAGLDVFGTDYPTLDGTGVRDYVHVCDVASAHVAALMYLRRGGAPATLNVGYGRGYSVLEVVDAVQRASGVDFPLRMRGRRPGDIAAIVAKADRIKQVLGWKPLHADLNQMVYDELAWARQHDLVPA